MSLIIDRKRKMRSSRFRLNKSFRSSRSILGGSLKKSIRWVSTRGKRRQTRTFTVTDVECDEMIEALSQEETSWKEEVKYLSKSWVKEVMAQPFEENKDMRRPFDYAEKKLVKYLAWRKEFGISDQISYYLNLTEGDEFRDLQAGSFNLYWYGVDKDGSPNLWLRVDKTKFNLVDATKVEKVAALVIQAALDRMPESVHNINVIIFCDKYNTVKAMKKPNVALTLMKTFMKVCQDRLKSVYFITGGRLGSVFHKVMNKFAPSNIIDKVIRCKSRGEAAKLLLRDNVLTELEIPTFMRGKHVQDEETIENFSVMIKKIEEAMNQ